MDIKDLKSILSNKSEFSNHILNGTSNVLHHLIRSNDDNETFNELIKKFLINSEPTVDELHIIFDNYKVGKIDGDAIKIMFMILEKLAGSKEDPFAKQVCEIVLQNTNDLMIPLKNLLKIEGSFPIFEHLLNEKNFQIFVSIFKTEKNLKSLKNCAMILPMKYEFVDLETLNLEDNELVFIRSTFLEIIFKKFLIERDLKLLAVLVGRLMDVHFSIRIKVLNLLKSIVDMNFLEIDQINFIFRNSISRIVDKTQFTRKAAINVCLSILSCDVATSLSSSNPGMFSSHKTEKDFSSNLNSEENRNQEFLGLINSSIDNLNMLIRANINRTELCSAMDYLKMCYSLGISSVLESYKIIFSMNSHLELTIDHLKEILLKTKSYDFLLKFEPSINLEIIIRELSKNYILKSENFTKFYEAISNKVENSIFLLSCIIRHLNFTIDQMKMIINLIVNEFFLSRDKDELIKNIKAYRDLLNLILNYDNKKLNQQIIALLIKNLIKMNFYDNLICGRTIKICFKTGLEYDQNIKKILKIISIKNVHKLKLISIIGDIAIEEMNLIDFLQIKAKKLKGNALAGNTIPNEVKERRRSINASRMSYNRLSEGMDVLMKNIINKEEDEILDILFYIKERELLFNNDALLFPYVSYIINNIYNEDVEVQKTCYQSVYKFMLVSSEFFEKNINIFFSGLKHKNYVVRNNSVIMLRDFFINYNFILERHSILIFDVLYDTNELVRTNGLMILFDLLLKNVIKPKGIGFKITKLLVDENQNIRNIVLCLFKRLSGNETMIASIFYETLLYCNVQEIKPILMLILPYLTDKVKEVCFTKLLRYKDNRGEVLKFYLDNANFSDKYCKEMSSFKDFTELRAS